MLIPRRAAGTSTPLTPAQARLWFLDQAGFGGTAYLCWTSKRYTAVIDERRLRAALGAVVDRHEALRTGIMAGPSGPSQFLGDAHDVLDFVDLTGVAGAEAEARRLSDAFAVAPLRLDRPPLHRALLIRLAADDHVLIWCLHHIICDGRSLGIIEDELFALYRGEPLPEVVTQFPDYAGWLAGQESPGREYWAERLRDAPAVQSPPTDRARPASPSPRGAHCAARLPAGLSADLLALGRRERCTPFVVFMAAMAAVLSRHTGEPDVVVGSPVSDRDMECLERSVGFYVNTLPLRVDLSGDPSLKTTLRLVRDALFGALGHRALPFEEIVLASGAPREPGRNPLFQTMLVLEPGGSGPSAAPPSTVWPLLAATSRLDLTLVVNLTEEIDLFLDYAADLFEPAEIERFRDHLVRYLEALVADPEQRVSQIPVTSGTAAALDPEPAAPVLELFTRIARTAPGSPALITADGELSYGELDRRSAELADRLRADDARLVAIVLPTGAEAIIAILGALRAGAAYLPLSPDDPPARTAALLAETGADVVIGPVDGDVAARRVAAGPDLPADLAYVIFTSGSTGRPKGVMVGHRSLAAFSRSFRDIHGFGPGQRVLMLPPLTFDASVGDLFPALTSGAALVLHPEPALLDGPELIRFCARHRVTAVDAPVALWRRWTDELGEFPDDWPVTTMMVGGERVPAAALLSWAAATGGRVSFFNHYGPTEATVCATVQTTVDGTEFPGAHLPIGPPLPHVRAHVLDPAGSPVPLGAPGELWLGGDCLALGYLGAPDLTAERFVPDPFAGGPSSLMYRTGDLVRRRACGSLEFLGRTDRQVKIRGYRIEPAEVESAVTAHPGVGDAAVVAVGDRLVAYAATTLPATELRRFVRERLPRHLVPDLFVRVDRIPRTAHQKIDLAALPPALPAEGEHVPPEGPLESALAGIWSDVLGVPAVGRTDGFFALGGSSLIATRVLAAIERDLGLTPPLSALFEAEDLAELARLLTEAPAAHAPDLWSETLPPEIAAGNSTAATASDERSAVLVTGATGFLGAHLVAELLATTPLKALCLVRAGSPAEARKRVLANLAAYGLTADPDRIEGLPGDLTEPRFGLTAAEWTGLASRCAVILHNGGLVNFTEPYERLRPANVGGTVEALRLAALGGVPMHAVSTLGTYLTADRLGERITELDPPGDPDGLPGPYEQTKWVADRLCRQARAAGLAVSIHRPARISGHSVTGAGNPEDYFNRLLTTFVQTGYVPDLPHTEDLAPVDHVAAAIVGTLLDPPGRDFHYFNPGTIGYPGLAEALRSAGHDVTLVPWARWRDAVNGRLASGAPLALAPFVSALPENAPRFPRPDFDCTATERVAGPCPPADRALIGRYLDFLAATGHIPRGDPA